MVDDAELWGRIREGDKTAFEELYHQLGPALYRFLVRMVGSEPIAQDLLQDLFVNLWQLRTEVQVSISLKGYLYRAAKNLAISHFRKAQIRRSYAVDDLENNPDTGQSVVEIVAGQLLEEAVRKAVQKLPERCRTAFVLNRFDGLSYNEIAQVMEISVETVHNHITKAVRLLRLMLSRYRNP